jgi:hypothetical protein
MLKLRLLCCTLTIVGLAASCAGDEAKKVISDNAAGEGGEAGSPPASAGASSLGGALGKGGDGPALAGAGQSSGGDQAAGAPGAGGGLNGGAGATGGDAGGQGGGGGDLGQGGDPGTPISQCGLGKYHAGEGSCIACPAPATVQIACSAYGNISASSNGGNLLYARMTPSVGMVEPFPSALVVSFVTPTTSLATTAEFNPSNSSWFISLDAGPDAPTEFTVPPFTATGACGHTYQSTQPIHFVRTATDTYTASCP